MPPRFRLATGLRGPFTASRKADTIRYRIEARAEGKVEAEWRYRIQVRNLANWDCRSFLVATRHCSEKIGYPRTRLGRSFKICARSIWSISISEQTITSELNALGSKYAAEDREYEQAFKASSATRRRQPPCRRSRPSRSAKRQWAHCAWSSSRRRTTSTSGPRQPSSSLPTRGMNGRMTSIARRSKPRRYAQRPTRSCAAQTHLLRRPRFTALGSSGQRRTR